MKKLKLGILLLLLILILCGCGTQSVLNPSQREVALDTRVDYQLPKVRAVEELPVIDEVVEQPPVVEEPVESELVISEPVISDPVVSDPIKAEPIEVEPIQPVKPIITTEERIISQAIPYSSIEENDATLEQGKRIISQLGHEGVREIIEVITYTDGKETSRVTKSNQVVKEPINQVVKVGTKVVVVVTPPPSNWALEVINLTNQYRQQAGLNTLTYQPALDAGANIRAQEIVGTWSHTRPNGQPANTAFNVRFSLFGENIAKGHRTPSAVMTGWMNSPGHKSNILTPSYTQLTAAVHIVDGYHYWVMMLYTP